MKRILAIFLAGSMAMLMLFAVYAPLNAQTPTPTPPPPPPEYFTHPVGISSISTCLMPGSGGTCNYAGGVLSVDYVAAGTGAHNGVQVIMDPPSTTLGNAYELAQWGGGDDSKVLGFRYQVTNWTNTIDYVLRNDHRTDGSVDLGQSGFSLSELTGGLPATICVHWHFPGEMSNYGCDLVVTREMPPVENIRYSWSVEWWTNNVPYDVEYDLASFEWLVYGVPTTPPDHTPSDLPWGASCSFVITNSCASTFDPITGVTTSLAITTSNGLTNTCEISHTNGTTETFPITNTVTVSSNLLTNGSFEQLNSGVPDPWLVQGAWTGLVISGSANSGNISLQDNADVVVYQDIPLFRAGTYEVGFYGDGPGIVVDWGGSPVVNSTHITPGAFSLVTGTHETGGGGAHLFLKFHDSGASIDDVYIIPVDAETHAPLCSADFYTDTETTDNLEPPLVTVPNPGGDPIPIAEGGPAGAKCYTCPRPNNLLDIGAWIGWLACIIKNLFSCSLRIWLYNITNAVMGVFRNFYALLLWLPTAVQLGINWLANIFTGAWDWLANTFSNLFAGMVQAPRRLLIYFLESGFVQALWRQVQTAAAVFEVVMVLIDAFVQLVKDLYLALVQFIEFLTSIFLKLRDAFSSPAYQITLTDGGQEVATLTASDVNASGANSSKLLWIFLVGIASMDALVSMYNLHPLFVLAVGALGVGIIFWTMKLWHDIVPI